MDVKSDIRIAKFFATLELFMEAQRNLSGNDLDFIRNVIDEMKEVEKSN